MIRPLQSVLAVVFVTAPLAVTFACQPNDPHPTEKSDELLDESEEASDTVDVETTSPVAKPEQIDRLLPEPPSGNYRLTRTTVSDTCTPKQAAGKTADNIGIVSRMRNERLIASVPAMLGPSGVTMARADMELTVGKTWESEIPLPCEGAKAKVKTTISEVGAKSFTLRVERTFEGTESCDAKLSAPTARCSAVEDLRYDVTESLCPARCAFDPRIGSSGLEGKCNCGRG